MGSQLEIVRPSLNLKACSTALALSYLLNAHTINRLRPDSNNSSNSTSINRGNTTITIDRFEIRFIL